MGDPRGFLKIHRAKPAQRPVSERVNDYREFVLDPQPDELRAQASRCMDCGIPFCHQGCPLANLIPEWNDLVYRGRMDEAIVALSATNNFPEVTGRVCPAPCEASCVLNIQETPVTIKAVERAIADFAIGRGLDPVVAKRRTGLRVAIVGSGPAGLTAAQQLARAGHDVTVFERADRVGGLLRYGIPDFKMGKGIIDLRIAQMEKEGVLFRTNVDVGGTYACEDLTRFHDAVVLTGGARAPRDLAVPGRNIAGVHFAMDFLTQQNRRVVGDSMPDADAILATGKRVVVIGGGDTGSDCVGTSIRQGASSVLQLEVMPEPPAERSRTNPWPAWPLILRTSSSQEEGCARDWAVLTKRVLGEGGRVRALEAVRVKIEGGKFADLPDTQFEIPCELVLLAMGFLGPEKKGVVEQLGVVVDGRGNVQTDAHGATSIPGVFAAGDMSRGQSLVVWAIADGRRVAAGVDVFLRQRLEARESMRPGIAAGL